jgi:hypothetical protein
MSKRINVNPDHYKVAGRERPGNAVAKAPKEHSDEEKARERWQRSKEKAGSRKPASRSKK